MVDEKQTMSLASPPKRYHFSPQFEKMGVVALERRLQSMNNTRPVEIRRPRHVLLNDEGLIQGKFRFTTTGLSQLCSALAPGLSQCVTDISGIKKQQEGNEDSTSIAKAIAIVNTLINLRFRSRLYGHGLVIDRGNKRVEGLVGPRYEFFSNLELFERCQEFAASLDPPAEFHEAIVAGRRLLLRYISPRRLFSVAAPNGRREPFYTGWHFSNSEIGDCSVRAGMTIIRKWTNTTSLFESGKIVHVKGGRFGPKFARLLEDLQRKTQKEIDEHNYESHITKLTQQPLELGGRAVAHARQVEKLAGKLTRVVFKRTARQVVHRAISHGSYRSDRISVNGLPYDMLESTLSRVIANRSAYDFYNAMTQVAKSLQPEQQEAAEHLAYKILTDRIKL